MSQQIKCKNCGELIDLDEAIQEKVQKELQEKSKELTPAIEEKIKKNLEKKFDDKSRQDLIKKLTPALKDQIKNENKLEHNKELEKERMKRERAENKVIKIEEEVRKAKKPIKQESSEIDGEVQERVLENYLKERFPKDNIIPVPKGKKGADCIQEIIENNTKCGKILWESKDTETFQENYVKKLYQDMSDNDIGFGVLAVDVVPKKLKEKFEFRENKKILVCKFDETLDLASDMFREAVIADTKFKLRNSQNLDESQVELWNLFNSDKFIILFRNVLKASNEEYKLIESDKTASDKSYKKRIKTWEDRKENLKRVIRHFVQVDGIKITPEMITFDDDDENN